MSGNETNAEIVAFLRQRADSYWRDSRVFADIEGQQALAAAYRAYAVLERLLCARNGDVQCLGQTKAGAPRHPLYLAASLEPRLFVP